MLKKLVSIFSRKKTIKAASHPTPAQSPYQMMGGEEAVRKLADRFYDIMASDPAAAELFAIHPQPMDSIRQRFFEFLSGWLGGPSLFEDKYGHPRLRARHLPFMIDKTMRDQWMYCMNKALKEEVPNPELRKAIEQALSQLASHMINQD